MKKRGAELAYLLKSSDEPDDLFDGLIDEEGEGDGDFLNNTDYNDIRRNAFHNPIYQRGENDRK